MHLASITSHNGLQKLEKKVNLNRIHSLESLRGLLAAWVVVGHTIEHSGYLAGDLGPARLLALPGLAVDVFIILSGFVIFYLLDKENPSFLQFVVRRWFRLAPVFLATLIASVLTFRWQLKIISDFPWRNSAIEHDLALHMSALQYFPEQFVAHVLMLHGLIADKYLPGSQYAFVGQAWSISVEWQFYLIAPSIYGLLHKKAWSSISGVILVVCGLRALNYGGEGFAINQAGYFLVGVASYYIWKHCDKVKSSPAHLELLNVIALAFVYLMLNRAVSLLIWVVVLGCIIAEKRSNLRGLQAVLSRALNATLLRWLGKLSYSIYMVHMLVFYGVSQAVFATSLDISKRVFVSVMVPTVLLLTIFASAITYQLVERPCIALGRRLTGTKQ